MVHESKAIAIVGMGAVLPGASNVATFRNNLREGKYSVTEASGDRWDPNLYYDPNPEAPDKSYSKIGGWVTDWEWEPLKWRMPIPPKVADAMDRTQKWAIICAREALADYGYPERPLDRQRTAVILGNAMAGDLHGMTTARTLFPEFAQELSKSSNFSELPETVRQAIMTQMHEGVQQRWPSISEDTMPGELSNIVAGRIAAVFDLHGPNYVVDAACASAMAGIDAAIEGLKEREYDTVITGGIDANMSASTFIKFCKIGALSATGTRPYAEGADGFVMGEGAAVFILRRLSDALRDGDKIYALIRGVGGSSDGKGKGITAPNPHGQKLAIQRAWDDAGLSPETVGLLEGHGTSTRVGDVAEVESLNMVFGKYTFPKNSLPLGSVKSNIGHLKGAAGAAGILKAVIALHEKILPPSLNCNKPNPNIDFAHTPFYVNTQLKPWDVANHQVRRAGVSAFGFGGTNFHVVLEEFNPNRLPQPGKKTVFFEETPSQPISVQPAISARPPLRGALLLGAEDNRALKEQLEIIRDEAVKGNAPKPQAPNAANLQAPLRLAVDYGDAAELAEKTGKALLALNANQPAAWRALRARGVFLGTGAPPKTAFLYTGQGSQYLNMAKTLFDAEPIVAQTFEEADRIMTPLLGKPLTHYLFVETDNAEALKLADHQLRQTEITQPAILTVDIALTRLMASYGIEPDMVMGHSLGEYGALVAAGALPFHQALEAVSARGREMASLTVKDNGLMIAVFGPLAEVKRILAELPGYLEIANINSNSQAVVGGASNAVKLARKVFEEAGLTVRPLPVSHAFHTQIVAPASIPLKAVLERMDLVPPKIPMIANVTGNFYPMNPNAREEMIELLGRQIASPVQFVKGLETLYKSGSRAFIEVGPKKALHGFTEDVLGGHGDITAFFTNHPKVGDLPSFNQALCGLYATGHGAGNTKVVPNVQLKPTAVKPIAQQQTTPLTKTKTGDHPYMALGKLFAGVLDEGMAILKGAQPQRSLEPVVISGAALGLPGTQKIFDDLNIQRIMRGDQFIDAIPMRFRKAMTDKHITRLVKGSGGEARFETIQNLDDVIKLAGRGGQLDLCEEFGFPKDRMAALDICTKLAIAAGLDALRDAGIPLIMRYKTTTRGTQLPERWTLPESIRDQTGIIFASAFPGYDALIEVLDGYHEDRARRERLADLESLHAQLARTAPDALPELEKRIETLRLELEQNPFVFDRRFLFRTLAMGHSQFAEYIGARGPNTQINSACASSTQAVSMAQDWIQAGRCSRVIIISADDVTSDNMIPWIGSGFLASGAAATDALVEDAALPFDRRRHGLLLGMGGSSMVVELESAAKERGIRPICHVLSTITANSAFHGSRLDVGHISGIMEKLVANAERTWGVNRSEIAPQTAFISHETYTPARGGSASAEVNALRTVFGQKAEEIVMANTKGFTGHAMGVGVEDVVAVKILETGMVPPVPNFKEIDPELGVLNLSKGGSYPVQYALRLGAGFGSQISMILLRWAPSPNGQRPVPSNLGYQHRIEDPAVWKAWLSRISGYDQPQIEVVQRTLRIADQGATSAKTKQAQPMKAKPVVVPSAAAAPAPKPELVEAAHVADEVRDRVLAIVAEQTGYPADMLEMDLDLEADLGVDTVKQAEMFAAIRAAYNIPREDNLKLRDFPTLERVMGFVYDRRPDLKTQAAPAIQEKAVEEPVTTPIGDDGVRNRILELVAEKTGYPSDMLEMDLDLEADLGVDTVKQAELFAAVRSEYNISRDDNLVLRDFPTLQHVVGFVYSKRPDLKTEPAPEVPASPQPVALDSSSPVLPEADPVREKILVLVAEKTGYPSDMLDLDLDLEADLGVDTVKQAELFAAVRDAYNIPREDNLILRDFPTLEHVIGFVYQKRPDLKSAQVAIPEPVEQPTHSVETASVEQAPEPVVDAVVLKILEVASQKTGYPADMLELDLDLEADLGIDTVKQAEMFAAICDAFHIPRDEHLALRDFPTLKHVIQFAYDHAPELQGREETAQTTAESQVQSPPNSVKETVLKLVAEKTGYPTDMLELDLDLEADLGIDTVKQAETLAAIRAAYNIPRDDSIALRDYATLARVIQFVEERLPADQSAVNTAQETPEEVAEAKETVLRRVPQPSLRPPLNLCKPTSVVLEKGMRVVVASDSGPVAKPLISRLKKRGLVVLELSPALSGSEVTTTIESWLLDGAIHGVYWLPALDPTAPLQDLNDQEWKQAVDLRVKRYYATMRALYQSMAQPGAFLVAATRLGGRHGYDPQGALDSIGGAVTGFTKAFKREQPTALVKAVDFEPSRKGAVFADRLIDETLNDPGVIEIGYQQNLRWTVGLVPCARPEGKGLVLNSQSVFLITGAAGSITAAITRDLAKASGGVFHLMDLTPKPYPDDTDLIRYETDRDNLKRDLYQRIKDRGERATPAGVDRELARLERLQAAMAVIRAVESAGGKAYYYSVNLTDAAAVAAVMDQVKQRSKKIDVVLHAAGLEISRNLANKKPAEFDLVFDVKCDGWHHLAHCLKDLPPAAVVAFSSVAGRFGNTGQTDYSAANDFLCKSISQLRNLQPETRGIVLDWTAWAGMGMATRGSIPAIMKAAGIDMLPPETGIPFVRNELTCGGTGGEVVVGGRLGMLTEEWDETGGLNTAAETAPKNGVMMEKVTGMGLYSGLMAQATLDPNHQPFLNDHRIDGTAVLPGVMGLEALAQTAGSIFLKRKPHIMENIQFQAPFKFYRDQSRTLTMKAHFSGDGQDIVGACSLLGSRTLHGKVDPEETTHFTAHIRLAENGSSQPKEAAPNLSNGKCVDAEAIYRLYFHGPAYRVLEKAWRSGNEIMGLLSQSLPANHEPNHLETLTQPRLLELCFQTAGVWEMGSQGRMGLPHQIKRLEIHGNVNQARGRMVAVVKPGEDGAFDARVLDERGLVFISLSGYRTMALPAPMDPALLVPLQSAMNL